MSKPLFPIFLKLERSRCLVVGGGAVAERKVKALLKAGASVTVASPEITDTLLVFFGAKRIDWNAREYVSQDLDGKQMVFAATDRTFTNQAVSNDCRARGIPVNVADNPNLCTFYMPTVVDRTPLQIAISTNGSSPMLAGFLRTKLELLIPPTYSTLAKTLGQLRPWVKSRIPDIKSRLKFWQDLFDSADVEKIIQGKATDIDPLTLYALTKKKSVSLKSEGQVYLVGAGPGNPDLLTVKALRLMQKADVVVHDHLVTEEILACARAETEFISVGKSRGCHSMQQSEINELLIRLGREGKQVVRLKGGDPFIFGRGGEELEALNRAGILCETVPGITAALGCAAATGIPLTHRNLAHSIVFMTGHFAKDDDQHDWARICQSGQTVVIYMGLTNLNILTEQLMRHGMRGAMPAALIEKGTTSQQKCIIGRVDELPEMAERGKLTSPVLVIIGDVVQLHDIHRISSHHFESKNEGVLQCHSQIQ